MTKESWAAALRREAPYATINPRGVVIHCTGCDAVLEVKNSDRPASALVRKTVNTAGWLIRNRRAKCVSCSGPRKPDKEEPVVTTTAAQDKAIREMNEKAALLPDKAPATESGAPAGTLAQQSAPARRLFRELMGWLEESYDEASKRYKKGFSDQSIAEETGAAVAFVAKTREDYFGPLGTPPEIETLRASLATLTRDIQSHGDTFKAKYARLSADENAAAAALLLRVKNITGRLDEIVKEQGWS
jgi:hypothetical protein